MAETVLWIAGAFLIFVIAVAVGVVLVCFVSVALFLRRVRKLVLEPVLKMAGIAIGKASDWVETKQIKRGE